MPKKAKELSALAISKIKSEGRHAVGGADGLHLRVAGRSRSWLLRVAVGTRTDAKGNPAVHRRDVGLGGYPEVTLAEARQKALELRKQIRDGKDPIKERIAVKSRERIEAAKSKTFKECAEAVVAQKAKKLRNAKALAQRESTLETYAYPILNNGRKVSDLTKHDVVCVLEPIWHTKRETASRLRGRIEAVFNYAKGIEAFLGDNPAEFKGTLEPLLGEQKQEDRKHHPALPHKLIGSFMVALRQRDGISARALEFVILTAARTNEVGGAHWAEIDLEGRTWTIPPSRMKAGREHVVTLSDAALQLLKSLPRFVGNTSVFPPPRADSATDKNRLSDMSLTAVIRRMHDDDTAAGGAGWKDPRTGKRITGHGFRSTFRDWTAEMGHDRDMAEMALAHAVGSDVERAYRRTSMVERRRGLMQEWAHYCATTSSSTVVPISREAA
jgi:integrase